MKMSWFFFFFIINFFVLLNSLKNIWNKEMIFCALCIYLWGWLYATYIFMQLRWEGVSASRPEAAMFFYSTRGRSRGLECISLWWNSQHVHPRHTDVVVRFYTLLTRGCGSCTERNKEVKRYGKDRGREKGRGKKRRECRKRIICLPDIFIWMNSWWIWIIFYLFI